MTSQHKVGQSHYYGLITADALKWDKSGNTVSMYENSDKGIYTVVEWDKSGEFEIKVDFYERSADAGIHYLYQAFNVTL